MGSYEEDCRFIEDLKRPVTHYIFIDDRPPGQQVFGALSLDHLSVDERRTIVCQYMAEGKRVVLCKNGPYKNIQPIYRAIREGRIP